MENNSGQLKRSWSWRRKFVATLLVLFVVTGTAMLILNRAGVVRRQNEMDKILAAGEPTSYAELNKRRVQIPDAENSALIIQKLFDRLAQEKQPELPVGRNNLVDTGERLSPEMLKLLGEYLDARKDLLASLHEAAKYSRGDYAVAWSPDGMSTLLPHLGYVRQASKLLAAEAVYEANLGRMDAAMDSTTGVLRVGNSIGDEPCLISVLVRFAIEQLALHTLEQVMALGQPGVEFLDRFAAELRSIAAEPSPYLWAMYGERVMVIAFFESLRKSGTANSVLSLGTGADIALRLVPGILDMNQQKYLQYMAKCVAASSLPLKDLVPRMKEIDAELVQQIGSPLYFMTTNIAPALARSAELYVNNRMATLAALTAIDAEKFQRQHGRWPKTLEELYAAEPKQVPLDPFDHDKPLHYHLTDDGCMIYSVGVDGVDDEGRFTKKIGGNSDIGFRLLTPDRRGARTTTQPVDEEVRKGYKKADEPETQPATP